MSLVKLKKIIEKRIFVIVPQPKIKNIVNILGKRANIINLELSNFKVDSIFSFRLIFSILFDFNKNYFIDNNISSTCFFSIRLMSGLNLLILCEQRDFSKSPQLSSVFKKLSDFFVSSGSTGFR